MNKFFAFLSSLSLLFTGCNKDEKPNVIVILGSPGAGKGTQAIELSKKLNLPHISTGDLFRANLSGMTELGKKAKLYIDRGQLVPDELVLGMLFNRIKQSDCKKGYILDGFPRTLAQAEAFDNYLNKGTNFKVINIKVADQTIIDRLSGRLVSSCGATYHKKYNPPKVANICDVCNKELVERKDDSEEVVIERLKVYHDQTEPLILYYKNKGTLQEINGEVEKDKVFEELLKAIEV